jgi:hypothetical protein
MPDSFERPESPSETARSRFCHHTTSSAEHVFPHYSRSKWPPDIYTGYIPDTICTYGFVCELVGAKNKGRARFQHIGCVYLYIYPSKLLSTCVLCLSLCLCCIVFVLCLWLCCVLCGVMLCWAVFLFMFGLCLRCACIVLCDVLGLCLCLS